MPDWADKDSAELGLAVISLPHLFISIPHSDTEISILQYRIKVCAGTPLYTFISYSLSIVCITI